MLIVYTGPMGSGKTTNLITSYYEYKEKNPRCMIFKPEKDTRYGCMIKTRNGESVVCNTIKKLDDLRRYAFTCDGFFIDEFQFLGGDINTINYLLDKNKAIYVSGLNLTAERKPFGLMGDLLCLADDIIWTECKCQNCKDKYAKFTHYTLNDKTDDIKIGDKEYIAVCPTCYKKLNKVNE